MIPRADERGKTILLKTLMQQHDEGRAAEDGILPGMLIEITSDSEDIPRTPPLVQKCTASGTAVRKLICKEDFLQGKGIGDEIDEGDIVPYHECQPGDVVLVRVADDYEAIPGVLLKSAGDGTFEDHGGSGVALFQIENAIDWGDVDVSELDETDPRAQSLVRAVAL